MREAEEPKGAVKIWLKHRTLLRMKNLDAFYATPKLSSPSTARVKRNLGTVASHGKPVLRAVRGRRASDANYGAEYGS